MKKYYKICNCGLVQSSIEDADIFDYTAPDDSEKLELVNLLNIDRYNLDSALDPDEISRVEHTPNLVSIIWKRPESVSFSQQLRFDVSSVGLFLHAEKLVIVTSNEAASFSPAEFKGINDLNDMLLRFLFLTIRHYLEHLKVIKQITMELESKISTSMGNRYLGQMFTLGESLIYYVNAIGANGTALMKLRGLAEKLKMSKQQTDTFDDIILDNQQCVRQAEIYSHVLSDLMDARGAMINNNMNNLLKNLTLINIIFMPLNLIAGIGGMSEFSMMTKGVDWKIAYFCFVVAMILFGWITWIVLVKSVDKTKKLERKWKR